MNTTKAKISLKEGLIELEGSEEFVKSYLDEFKKQLQGLALTTGSPPSATTAPAKRNGKTKLKKSSDESTVKPKPKKAANKISPERFEIHGGDGVPSLSDFMNAKKPGQANGEKIVVIGYYITEILGNKTFTEGQIEYAYRMLKYKRPEHLHQIILNTKSQKDWFDAQEDGSAWQLTRGAEIYVADELPRVVA